MTEPGEPNVLKVAFWEAMNRCDSPPYLGSVGNGDEGWVDGFLPEDLWGHMADVLGGAAADALLGAEEILEVLSLRRTRGVQQECNAGRIAEVLARVRAAKRGLT